MKYKDACKLLPGDRIVIKKSGQAVTIMNMSQNIITRQVTVRCDNGVTYNHVAILAKLKTKNGKD